MQTDLQQRIRQIFRFLTPLTNQSISKKIKFMNMLTDSIKMTFNESMEKIANISTQIDKMDDISSMYLYITLLLIFLCAISVIININILISSFWLKRPISPTLHMSLSLAGADAFTSATIGLGFIFNNFISHRFQIKLEGINCFVLALGVLKFGGIIITVYHLTALAVNHYVGVVRPLHYRSIFTHKNTIILLSLLWILPIFFFTAYSNLIEGNGFQSEECKENAFLHKKFRILFSILFFLPFGFMVGIYIHIFRIIQENQAMKLRFHGGDFSDHEREPKAKCRRIIEMRRNKKAVYTTLYILGSFVIGWMPTVLVYIYVCIDCMFELKVSNQIQFVIYCIINGFIILKNLINPLIYAARMNEIKVARQRMHNACYDWINHFTTNQEINEMNSIEERNSQLRTGTTDFELFQNISVQKTRNRGMFMYTGNNAQEYGETSV